MKQYLHRVLYLREVTVTWAFASKTSMNSVLEQSQEISNYVMVVTVSAKSNV